MHLPPPMVGVARVFFCHASFPLLTSTAVYILYIQTYTYIERQKGMSKCMTKLTRKRPLMARCRERRELIRAAANHRYALAAAHVSYFRSLKDVGNAIRKFVDEELSTSTHSSSSVVSSPSLSLPPNSKKKSDDSDESQLHDEDENESHLQISSSFEDDNSDSEDDRHRRRSHPKSFDKNKDYNNEEASHVHEEVNYDYPRGGYGFGDEVTSETYSYPLPTRSYEDTYPGQYTWGPPGMHPWNYWSNSSVYYMKKSATAMRTVVHDPPTEPSNEYLDSYGNIPSSYGPNYGYFSTGSTVRVGNESVEVSPPKEPPPPPPPPPPASSSAWDFFNPFDEYDNVYPGYYSSGRYRDASNSSSPDSSEVRKREGIPDLEEETENETYKEVSRGKKTDLESKKRSEQSTFGSNRMHAEAKKNSGGSIPSSRSMPPQKHSEDSSSSVPLYKSEGSSISVSLHKSGSSSRSLPSWNSEENTRSVPPHHSDLVTESSSSLPHSKGTSSSRGITGSISLTDERSSIDTLVSKSVDEDSSRKKGVSFEESKRDADSPKLGSLTSLSPHGTRDVREVVGEIRDEFEIASGCGKEVAVILEVDKLPYQPSFFKVILSQILHLLVPSPSLWDHPSRKSMKLASRTLKLAKSYFEDVGTDVNAKACNLSSTLDKLYAWERKLYREVKDEERLRVIYEKQCKRLKILDEEGAECSKIDAAQDSIKRLLTKLDVSIKAIGNISGRIQKLRDEELQPQVATLIQGMIRMWKAMLKCHQKQFEAIMESKMQKLKASTGLHTDSSTRAATVLERELQAWTHHLNDWIGFQKSYVESLNGWLLQCLLYEPEETPDGQVPYSPGRLGAPPIFMICNDWRQALEAITEAKVANAMNAFATSLRQLLEKQVDEERQRLKAEYLMKEYEKHLKTQHRNRGKMERDQDVMSDQTGLSVVPSDRGVSPLDDPKVDLDSMRQKAAEERIKHKDAMKLVHDTASSSLEGGLVPILKALKNFSSEALKAYEHVRLQHTEQSL